MSNAAISAANKRVSISLETSPFLSSKDKYHIISMAIIMTTEMKCVKIPYSKLIIFGVYHI